MGFMGGVLRPQHASNSARHLFMHLYANNVPNICRLRSYTWDQAKIVKMQLFAHLFPKKLFFGSYDYHSFPQSEYELEGRRERSFRLEGDNWTFHEVSGQGMNCGPTGKEIDRLVFAVWSIGLAGDRGFV
jgi:hypothetical protein